MLWVPQLFWGELKPHAKFQNPMITPSCRVVRAMELDLIKSKGRGLNPLCGTCKFHSMDIVKLDAVQLYKYQISNRVVDALVLWVACREHITLEQSERHKETKTEKNKNKSYIPTSSFWRWTLTGFKKKWTELRTAKIDVLFFKGNPICKYVSILSIPTSFVTAKA
jgi:hypothetical protein